MIVLTLEPGRRRSSRRARRPQRRYGMPIDPAPYPRPALEPAAGGGGDALNAPAAEQALLRRLRVRVWPVGLLDDRRSRAGPTSARPGARTPRSGCLGGHPAARSPSPAARALDHKLGGPARGAPLHRAELRDRRLRAARLQPGRGLRGGDRQRRAGVDAPRRSRSRSRTLLAWAGEPLATAEIQHDHGRRPGQAARRARAGR